MNIYDELENLKAQARLNPALAQALLDTRTVSNPVTAFLPHCAGKRMHIFGNGPHFCRGGFLCGDAAFHEWWRGEFSTVAGGR